MKISTLMEYSQFDFTEVLEENMNTCTSKIMDIWMEIS